MVLLRVQLLHRERKKTYVLPEKGACMSPFEVATITSNYT